MSRVLIRRTLLRALFNKYEFWQRAKEGTLTQKLRRDDLPSSHSGEPSGSISQIIGYLDDSMDSVAVVHQYRRPDGSIGGKGRPDPYYVVLADVRWWSLGDEDELTAIHAGTFPEVPAEFGGLLNTLLGDNSDDER